MPNEPLLSHCQNILASYPAARFVIGYSGGRDSHVLLDILCQLKQQKRLSADLVAIHIHHGLSPNADAWQFHCQSVCLHYGVSFITEKVVSKPPTGESIEAFARAARYELIQAHINSNSIFLSAHHQRDQAETFLLQLMRGAGIAGLRAMPEIKPFAAGRYLRPLLKVSYNDVVRYAQSRQLSFIEDESNVDIQFDRNYMRHQVLPVLTSRFPQAEQAIATSAAWLAEIPEQDVPKCLMVNQLKALPISSQKNQIRGFVKAKTGLSMNRKQLDYVLSHHLRAAPDKHPELTLDSFVVRRRAGEIIITKALPTLDDNIVIAPFCVGECRSIEGFAELNWQAGQGGLLPSEVTLQLLPLNGSQRFHPHTRRHSQTIKKLLLEHGVPTWLRPYMFGIYANGVLVAIPGIGVAQSVFSLHTDAQMPQWIIASKFAKI